METLFEYLPPPTKVKPPKTTKRQRTELRQRNALEHTLNATSIGTLDRAEVYAYESRKIDEAQHPEKYFSAPNRNTHPLVFLAEGFLIALFGCGVCYAVIKFMHENQTPLSWFTIIMLFIIGCCTLVALSFVYINYEMRTYVPAAQPHAHWMTFDVESFTKTTGAGLPTRELDKIESILKRVPNAAFFVHYFGNDAFLLVEFYNPTDEYVYNYFIGHWIHHAEFTLALDA